MGQGSPLWHVVGSPGRPRSLGKRLRKLLPSPVPRGLWDWESSFLHRQLLSPPGWGRLNPSGAGIRESRGQRRCSPVFSQVWPEGRVLLTCHLPLAVVFNTLIPESRLYSPRLPEVVRIQLVSLPPDHRERNGGTPPRGGQHSICPFTVGAEMSDRIRACGVRKSPTLLCVEGLWPGGTCLKVRGPGLYTCLWATSGSSLTFRASDTASERHEEMRCWERQTPLLALPALEPEAAPRRQHPAGSEPPLFPLSVKAGSCLLSPSPKECGLTHSSKEQ